MSAITQDEMRKAIAEYYANGGSVPPEIAALPNPGRERVTLATPGKAKSAETAYIKCDGKGMEPVSGTDADGLKGKCPACPGVIGLTDTGMISAHLVGGVNAPLSKALTERQEPVRAMGEGSRVIGNGTESARTVCGIPGGAPLVRGRDMGCEVPVRRTREEAREQGGKRSYAEAAGTMAGSTGRMRLDGGALDTIAGGRQFGWLSTAEVGKLSRSAQRRYWTKIKRAKDAAKAASARRRAFNAAHPEFRVSGSGPTAARPFTVPTGTRTAQMWDSSKGGRTVETVERTSRERSPLDGIRMDEKPFGIKYKSEPVFGRTSGR